MGIDDLFSKNIKSIFDKYKHIDVVCNTKEEWDKGHEEITFMRDNAIREGYKGICVDYKGQYVMEMLHKINMHMAEVHRDYQRKSAKSEINARNIFLD